MRTATLLAICTLGLVFKTAAAEPSSVTAAVQNNHDANRVEVDVERIVVGTRSSEGTAAVSRCR